MTASPSVLLRVEALSFGYPGVPLLRDLSFDIGPGVCAITGDESAGKTTLLRLLAGELSPDRGQIVWWPGAATRAAPLPADLCWFAPRSDAWEQHTVRDFHRSGGRTDVDEALWLELADEIGLNEHLHKQLFMLSTGTKRKVYLATAFASRAAVTLLDEPMAALDGPSIRVVRGWLQEAADHPSRAWVVADHAMPPGVAPQARVHLARGEALDL